MLSCISCTYRYMHVATCADSHASVRLYTSAYTALFSALIFFEDARTSLHPHLSSSLAYHSVFGAVGP